MDEASYPSSADRRLAALFPDEAGPATVTPWWRRRRLAIILAVVVALGASGLAAATAFGSSGDDYRTATVATRNVDAVQTGVATIEPVAQASVAFPVSGTVASVNVQVGQPVEASGTLASLDTQALMQTLHVKQAALAQAQLTVSKALAGQSVGTLGGGGSGSGASGSGASGSGGAGATTAAAVTAPTASRGGDRIVLTAADPQLAADQQAVLAAQQQVDAALAAAATALDAETTVCASFTAPVAPAATTPSATPAGPDVTACQQAITAVGDAQHGVAAAQQTLAAASNTLDALLAQLTASPPPAAPPPTTAPPATAPTGRGGGTGSGSGTSATGGSGAGGSGTSRSGTSGGSSSPTAADLVAYQRSVDAASAAVAMAQQSLDQATISSPLAGTVVAVDMKVGDAVSADSSTERIVVQGAGGYEVTTAVSVDDIPSVSVGQGASVVPDGAHTARAGKVVAISVAPTATSTSATLYRVTIGLADPEAKLDNGATGTVSIVTKQAKAALAVPTSAITTVRNRYFVTLLSGGTPSPVPVRVGVVGATWTAITGGLRSGQQVVLADESAALPSSATASATSTAGTGVTGGIGSFGGGGRGFGGGGRGRTG